MSGLISPEARAARRVALAAVESPASAYGIADTVVFALDSAGLLQTPEIAAELARLRGLADAGPQVWHVFEEDGPRAVPPLFATKVAAEDETIARYEEMEGSCPDYSWRLGDDSSFELLAGGEPVGIYLHRVDVHGLPDTVDEPAWLAEIRAREAAATRGPWGTYDDGTGRLDIVAALQETGTGYTGRREIAQTVESPMDNDPDHVGWEDEDDDGQASADGQFIAAARTDVPALLAEVDRLRGENRGHVEHAGALLAELRAVELGKGELSMLALALDLAAEHVADRPSEFTDADQVALAFLRRIATKGGERS